MPNAIVQGWRVTSAHYCLERGILLSELLTVLLAVTVRELVGAAGDASRKKRESPSELPRG